MLDYVNSLTQDKNITNKEEDVYGRFYIFKRMLKYNKPAFVVFLSLLTSIISSGAYPFFGIMTIKITFVLMKPDKDEMWRETDEWILIMVIGILVRMLAQFIQKYCFAILGENMTLGVRKDLYK